MDAKAVSRITIVCHLFSAMSILLHFELDSDPGRRGEGCCVCSGGRGGGGVPLTWLSMKSLRILLHNTFTSGIEPLQSVLGVGSCPHLPLCLLHTSTISLTCSELEQSSSPQSLRCRQRLLHVTTHSWSAVASWIVGK